MAKKKRITLIVIIVLLIAGMALYPKIKKKYFADDGSRPAQPASGLFAKSGRPLNVNVEVLQYASLNDVFKSTGSLIPDEEVDLSFETSGKITDIYFKEGTEVKKGALLAKVNDSPLQAELKKLQTQIPLAEDRLFRQKSLLAKDAVSQEAYEQVKTELDKLNADIELVKSRIAQTELRAPFDGIIGLRLVSDGAYVSPTTVVAKLTKISPLKIEFSINERHVNSVRSGTPLRFYIDGRQYQATVYAVESKIDIRTRTLKARAVYANPGGRLKPGSSTLVEIIVNAIKNTLTVPSESMVAEMGRDIVYLYKGGKAQQMVLTKGIRTESRVQILNGLQVGDTLIVSGVMQLRDGMPVTIDHIIENENNK